MVKFIVNVEFYSQKIKKALKIYLYSHFVRLKTEIKTG